MHQRQDPLGQTNHLSGLSHILRFISIRESGKLRFITYYVLDKKLGCRFGGNACHRKTTGTVSKRELAGNDAIAKCRKTAKRCPCGIGIGSWIVDRGVCLKRHRGDSIKSWFWFAFGSLQRQLAQQKDYENADLDTMLSLEAISSEATTIKNHNSRTSSKTSYLKRQSKIIAGDP